MQRVWQHRNAQAGFTVRYHCKSLVYYEIHAGMTEAITREKQIKGVCTAVTNQATGAAA